MSVISDNNYLKTSLNCSYYSINNEEMPSKILNILNVFYKNVKKIETVGGKNHGIKSDLILKNIESDLKSNGFDVESDKKHQIGIRFNNTETKTTKEFRVDAINIDNGIIVEIEAGRAVANYQFLKDIMECSMISSKKKVYINNELVEFKNKLFLVLAVRNVYTINKSNHYDYNSVMKWLNTIDISSLNLNLNGILLIGY